MTCEGAFVCPTFPFSSHRRQMIIIVLSVREKEELVMKSISSCLRQQLMVVEQEMLKNLMLTT